MLNSKQKLYILSSCCDEGFNGPEFIYYAQSYLEVAQHISREMNLKSDHGKKLLRILMRSDIEPKGNDKGTCKEMSNLKEQYILSLSPQELLDAINETRVDGDSAFQTTLVELDIGSAIRVAPILGGVNVAPIMKFNANDQLAGLIDFVFKSLEVHHLEWDGKTWYSHSMCEWSSRREDIEYGPHDPDYPCYGYWAHDFDPNTRLNEGDPGEDVQLPYKPHRVERFEDFTHVFKDLGEGPFKLDTKIRLEYNVHICNPCGQLNSDHRGSNHLGIGIDHLFGGSVVISAGVYTVAEFANLAWQVKGNKFDNQYETVFAIANGGKIHFEDNEWFVDLSVDHGS